MRCLTALGLLVAVAGWAQPAAAADYGAIPYAPASASAPIVELGSGWYLRGDLGIGDGTQAQFDPTTKAPSNKTTWTGDIGFGYKINSYLRTDLTLNYFKPQHLSMQSSSAIVCPYTLIGLSDQVPQANGGAPLKRGYLFAPQAGTCTQAGSADLSQANALASAYVDLGTYYGITPYIGAGAGVAMVGSSGSSDYYKTSDGSPYRTDLTANASGGYPLLWTTASGRMLSPQPTAPNGQRWSFGPQNFSQSYKKTTYGIAWALMAGFAYKVTDQAFIDLGYQYVNNGVYTSAADANGKTVKRDLTVQQVKVGFRYQLD